MNILKLTLVMMLWAKPLDRAVKIARKAIALSNILKERVFKTRYPDGTAGFD